MLRMFLQSYNLCLKIVYAYQKKKTMDYIQSLREDLEEGMGPLIGSYIEFTATYAPLSIA